MVKSFKSIIHLWYEVHFAMMPYWWAYCHESVMRCHCRYFVVIDRYMVYAATAHISDNASMGCSCLASNLFTITCGICVIRLQRNFLGTWYGCKYEFKHELPKLVLKESYLGGKFEVWPSWNVPTTNRFTYWILHICSTFNKIPVWTLESIQRLAT